MQHDTVIWQVIGNNFCSFKVRTPDDRKHFCRNEYNLTGLCNRQDCPLANSQYATVRNVKGKCVLMMKTIERAHLPSKLWDKFILSDNAEEADRQCKKRSFRLRQVVKQMRKVALQKPEQKTILTTHSQKIERREKRREIQAEAAARLEKSIEKELLVRLEEGVYGEIYNITPEVFEKVTENTIADKDQMLEDEEIEYEEDEEEEYLSEDISLEEENEPELEESDIALLFPKRQKREKTPVVQIEYEKEEEEDPKKQKISLKFRQ